MNRLIIWLVFVLAMTLILSMSACWNITPVRMAERGYCWDGTIPDYRPCVEVRRGK